MRIPFAEPTAPRYIYVDPETNQVHLLVPIVGGQDISTDNTCKSTVAMDAFFQEDGALRELNAYKDNPTHEQKEPLFKRFEEVLTTKVTFEPLRKVLAAIHKKKSKLLKLLDRPFIPLHNNASEQSLRDLVIKRKISGGSKSDWGKKARDIANTLIQTCYKQGIAFWDFILDRISFQNKIAQLSDLIRAKAKTAAAGP